MPNLIQDLRDALAGACSTPDPEVALIYTAVARARLEAAKRELVALETIVDGREKEVARLAHALAEQLSLRCDP